MNRQTTVTLLVVLIAFRFSMTTAIDVSNLPPAEQQEFMKEFNKMSPEQQRGLEELQKLLKKVAAHLNPEQLKLFGEAIYAQSEEEAARKIDEVEKTLSSDQKKKILDEFDSFVNALAPEIQKEVKPKMEEFKKHLKSGSNGSSSLLITFGVMAIVAALTVF